MRRPKIFVIEFRLSEKARGPFKEVFGREWTKWKAYTTLDGMQKALNNAREKHPDLEFRPKYTYWRYASNG